MAPVPTITVPVHVDQVELDAALAKAKEFDATIERALAQLREVSAALTAANEALRAILPAQKPED